MSKVQTMLLSGALLSLLSGCIEVEEEKPQTSEPQVIEIEEQEVQEQEEVKEEEQLVIKMNEPFTVGAYSSETYEHIEQGFEVTIQSVRLSQVFNESYEEEREEEERVENIAIIKLEVKNISGEKQYFAYDNFNYYDMDSNVLSSYPTVDVTHSDVVELNPNRKATLEFAIGIPHGTDFEMEIINNTIDCEPVGSVFFISGELQESEEQSPIERAEDIIDNVTETVKGE